MTRVGQSFRDLVFVRRFVNAVTWLLRRDPAGWCGGSFPADRAALGRGWLGRVEADIEHTSWYLRIGVLRLAANV